MHRPLHARMKFVEMGAAAKMHDHQAPVCFQRARKPAEGRRGIAEVGEAVKTEDEIVAARAEIVAAHVAAEEIGGDALRPRPREHFSGEIHGGDPRGRHLFREPRGGLPRSATYFENGLAGAQGQAGGMPPQSGGLAGGGRFLALPAGGERVEKADAWISGAARARFWGLRPHEESITFLKEHHTSRRPSRKERAPSSPHPPRLSCCPP